MLITLNLVLLILAFLCFAMVAIGVVSTRVNLTGLGLALWVLALLLGRT